VRLLAMAVRRRSGAVLAVAAVSLALTACAPDTSMPPPTQAPPADHVVVDFTVNEAQGVRATGAEFTDRFGTYRQVELAPDAPAREFDPQAFDALVLEIYGADLAAQGQSFAAEFIAKHYMDNPAVYDNSRENRFAYRDSTEGLIVPAQSQVWADDVLDSAAGWATDKQVLAAINTGAGVLPYASGQARYALRTFDLESATLNEADGGIVFTFAVEYDRPMLSAGTDAYLTTSGKYVLVVVADVSDDWFVSGWGQDVDSTLYYWDGTATQRELKR